MKLLTGKCEKDFTQWLRPDITSDHRYSELMVKSYNQALVDFSIGITKYEYDYKNINELLTKLKIK